MSERTHSERPSCRCKNCSDIRRKRTERRVLRHAEVVAAGLPEPEDGWERQAQCKDAADPSLFFPERLRRDERAALAERLCAGCHVKESCLTVALRNEEKGIWGGTDDFQRRQIMLAVIRQVRRPA